MHKTLRKNAVEILNRVGFKDKNASKIIKTVEFKESLSTHSLWTSQLSILHLYELSRIHEAGNKQTIAESSTDKTILIGIDQKIQP